MASNKVKAKDLQGLAIHHGEKQTFLLDWFDGTPRVIDNDDAKAYSLWQMKMPAAILVGCIIFSYNENVPLSFVAGVVVFIAATIAYEFMFVKKLPEAKKFEKEKKEPVAIRMAKEFSVPRLIASAVLSFALAVLLIVYANVENYQGIYRYTTYGLSAIVSVLAAISAYALFIKINNEKK